MTSLVAVDEKGAKTAEANLKAVDGNQEVLNNAVPNAPAGFAGMPMPSQQQQMRQDEELDMLSEQVQRLNAMATEIGAEVETQSMSLDSVSYSGGAKKKSAGGMGSFFSGLFGSGSKKEMSTSSTSSSSSSSSSSSALGGREGPSDLLGGSYDPAKFQSSAAPARLSSSSASSFSRRKSRSPSPTLKKEKEKKGEQAPLPPPMRAAAPPPPGGGPPVNARGGGGGKANESLSRPPPASRDNGIFFIYLQFVLIFV